VTGNTAEEHGGGMVNATGTMTIVDSQITSNTALRGAGIYNNYYPVKLFRTVVSQNVASDTGGGIHQSGAPWLSPVCLECGLILRDGSRVTNNKAERGGGIFNAPNSVTRLEAGSSVTGNTATTAGGGVFNLDGTMTIAASTIVTGNSPNNCAGDDIPATCVG
jgi:hypothetical protein